jgi:hypothetical protein
MICLWCQVEFYQNRDWQRFCCKEHQQAWNRHERKVMEVTAAEVARERRLNGPVKVAVEEPVKSSFVRRI